MHAKLSLYNPPKRSIVSYREMIDTAASLGLSYVEGFSNLEFSDPDLDAARAVRAYADEKGIRFSCLSVFADLVGEERERFESRLFEYARVAEILGSAFLHHTIAPRFLLSEASEAECARAFETGVFSVRRVFDFARECGVRTVFENQAFLFNGRERYGAFLSAVEREVGVVADFGNIFQADERITAFLQAFSSRVVHVHLKDMKTVGTRERSLLTLGGSFVQECDLGTGEVDFFSALAVLKQSGYDGLFSVERHAYDADVEIEKQLAFANKALVSAGF